MDRHRALPRTEALVWRAVSVTEGVLQEHTRSRRSRSVRIVLATPEHPARCIAYQADTGMAGTKLRTGPRRYCRTPVSVWPPGSVRSERIRTRPWRSPHTAQSEQGQGTERSGGTGTEWCTDRYTLHPCTEVLASLSASDLPGRTRNCRSLSSRTALLVLAPPIQCISPDEHRGAAGTKSCTDRYT